MALKNEPAAALVFTLAEIKRYGEMPEFSLFVHATYLLPCISTSSADFLFGTEFETPRFGTNIQGNIIAGFFMSYLSDMCVCCSMVQILRCAILDSFVSHLAIK